ncbi:MAG: hypothetical protein IH616_16440 [Gemmatimonadales bacterium]|jgi:hypothetical protein|nr:hypothetical protein [Gemmatimonadales bacterium]
MTILERLGGEVQNRDGDLPRMAYHWDAETEILSGSADVVGREGLTGSIELEDDRGAVVTLDFEGGLMRGVEVVVWPPVKTREALRAPRPVSGGEFVVPTLSDQAVAVVEIDVPLSAESSADETVIHLRVGSGRPARTVALAENLLLDLDAKGELTGLWLLDVPPFPTERELG